MAKKIILLLICILTVLGTACTKGTVSMSFIEKHPVCYSDSDWTNFFNRAGTENGWLCADGIYSVALNGNDEPASADIETKTLFIFSDTKIGSADKEGNIKNSSWANHSAAVLEGDKPDPDKMTFYYGYKASMETGENSNLFGENQWLFDMFVLDNSVFILAFTQEDWKPVQIDLIEIPISEDFEPLFDQFKRTENISQLLKKCEDHEYAFGIGILNNTSQAGAVNADEYIYIYGYRDNIKALMHPKDLLVARIHKDDIRDFSKIRFWTGSEWSENIEDSKPLIEQVSCELSVSRIQSGAYEGKYAAVYTYLTQSESVMVAFGDSPVGPFSEPIQIYTSEESHMKNSDGNNYYTYNAKAHPHLSEEGSLLISYNVNVINGDAVNTTDYHPRFIKLNWGTNEFLNNK